MTSKIRFDTNLEFPAEMGIHSAHGLTTLIFNPLLYASLPNDLRDAAWNGLLYLFESHDASVVTVEASCDDIPTTMMQEYRSDVENKILPPTGSS